jgi:hypothetical protein
MVAIGHFFYLPVGCQWSTYKNANDRRNAFLPKTAKALFSEQEREGIVAMVSANPEQGDLLQGTGRFRKVRLIAAYAKNEKDNLTKAERNALEKVANAFLRSTGGRLMAMFDDLKKGLGEVDTYLAGKHTGYKVTVPAEIDVRASALGCI